jgi:succinate dehydrogenase/fumarate reductase flavoprotein subunit
MTANYIDERGRVAVIVVGGGMAGPAAVAEGGARVALLEKVSRPGGSAAPEARHGSA